MLDGRALRLFLAVADEGSITKAAEVTGYTPSNVTQQVRALERALGRPLLERQGRGIRLTGDGEALARHARPLVDGLLALPAALGGEETASGTVTVAAVPTVVRGLLVPAMARLALQAPAVQLVPRELEATRTIVELRSGRADLAITKYWAGVARPELPATLRQSRLLEERVDVLLPETHRLAGAEAVRVSDLGGETWAVAPPEDPFRDWLEATLPSSTYSSTRRIEAVEEQTLLSYVQAGLAVGALPRLGRGELPTGVVAKTLDDPRASRAIVIVRPRAGIRAEAVDAVLDAVRAVVGDLQPALLS